MKGKAIVIPFILEHLKLIELEKDDLFGTVLMTDVEKRLELFQSLGNGVTIIYKNIILGIIGFYEMWPRVCELWAAPSIYMKKYSLVYSRILKKYVEEICENLKFRRVQVTTLNNEKYNRWLKFLNFQSEGILRSYSYCGEDFKMWSRINLCQ
jgi:hypothetical protein